jgi:hypothetical protein
LQAQRKDHEDIKELSGFESKIIEHSRSILFGKVDWTRFQNGYNKETIFNITTWITCGCLSEFSEALTEAKVYKELER